MSYNFTKVVSMSYDEALVKVPAELGKEGFGILTEVDVTGTLKKKLGVDFRRYRILGACNPAYAHKAFQAEGRIGVMLPCSVVVQEWEDGRVEVSAVNPMETMKAVGNPNLEPIAQQVSACLQAVIARL